MTALLALASAATFGVADFCGGVATRNASVVAVTLISNLSGAVVAAILFAIVGGEWAAATVAWSVVGGVCGLAGLVLLYMGLAAGPNRLVSPLSAVVSAILPILIGVTLGERPSTIAVAGLAIAPLAVWLLAGGEFALGGAQRKSIALAASGGLGFGLFYVLISQVPAGSGAVPLMVVRVVSVGILVVAGLIYRPKFPTAAGTSVAIAAGSMDMTANGLFLWATRSGDLSIVGALVSLFPATTVLLAVLTLGERLSRSQVYGLGLALVAAGLLS